MEVRLYWSMLCGLIVDVTILNCFPQQTINFEVHSTLMHYVRRVVGTHAPTCTVVCLVGMQFMQACVWDVLFIRQLVRAQEGMSMCQSAMLRTIGLGDGHAYHPMYT